MWNPFLFIESPDFRVFHKQACNRATLKALGPRLIDLSRVSVTPELHHQRTVRRK